WIAGCRAPDVVANQRGRRRGGIGPGVELGIAAEIVRRAMPVVASALHLHGDDPARRVPEFRVGGVLLYIQLRHGVHGWNVVGLGTPGVWRAVDQNIVLELRAAADIKPRASPVMERTLLAGRGGESHLRIEGEQKEWVAVNDGKRVRHFRIEGRFHRRLVDLNRTQRLDYANRFGQLSDFEPGVDRHVRSRLHQDIFLDEAAKTLHLHAERIGPGADEVEQILSGVIAYALNLNVRAEVFQGNLSADDKA